MPPRLQFFPFSLHSYLGYLLSFYLQTTFFFCFISKETAGASWSQLWKDKKESHHPLTWKEIADDHRIRSESKILVSYFFLTRDYNLELM